SPRALFLSSSLRLAPLRSTLFPYTTLFRSAVHFFLDSAVVPINLIGDGLLPADIDGTRQPEEAATIPIVGTQDDGGPYGATSDADRKSTRLKSSHDQISYAVFSVKKNTINN